MQPRIEPHRLYIGVNYHPHDWPAELLIEHNE